MCVLIFTAEKLLVPLFNALLLDTSVNAYVKLNLLSSFALENHPNFMKTYFKFLT